jgi:hypothetical protein
MTKVTVPGQDYGKQAEQRRAMAAVPTVNMQQQLTSMEKAAAPLEKPGMAAPATAAPTQQAPVTTLDMPTTLPDQHLTHGLPVGPGPGPEVSPVTPQSQIANILQALADGPFGTADIANLAAYAKNQGY